MNIELHFTPHEQLHSLEAEALVVILPPTEPKWGLASVTELYKSEEFSGKPLETALLHRPQGWAAKRLMLVGCGDKADALGPLALWRAAAVAARTLKGKGLRNMTVVVPGSPEDAPAQITALITGVDAANFETDTYKSDRKTDRQIATLTIEVGAKPDRGACERAAREAAIIADGVRFARELENEPGNRMTPTVMGQRAQAMAKEVGLECELIGIERARELKMGSFLSVGQGSAEPSCMMVLRYNGAPESKEVLGIIGKGITFDSGGISIKPAANMDEMKFDMCGGAATLGAMKALAGLKPKINVLAIVASAENMPGGKAQKPGDVQIAMSGKSIEILNTDAEGRLVLADALHFAKELGATRLINSATLTGACVVALGNVNAGVFSNSDEFYARFERARATTGEKMWRLPLDTEYADQIKGTVGDILNTGGRWGGAITAAEFLHAFVGETPWIHLDIAGTAYLSENKAWMPKGPTGSPTATLIALARELAGK